MIDTAVIMAAGYGTRFLPATKNVPKEMLPLIDVPILHEVVKECIDSGIKKIIIVTRHGNNEVEDYFDNNKELEDYLEKMNKSERYVRFHEVFDKAEYAYVRQNKSLPYGNASPVLAAKPFLAEGKPFAVLFGDDLVLSDKPGLKQVMELFEAKHSEHGKIGGICTVSEVAPDQVDRYGIVKAKEGTDNQLEKLVEKPPVGDSPSNLAILGRYIFSWDIFDHLSKEQTGKDGELWIADASDRLAQKLPIFIKVIEGQWHTTGDPIRLLRTTIAYALVRPDLREDTLKAIKDSLAEVSEKD